jgi:hypothetical protein
MVYFASAGGQAPEHDRERRLGKQTIPDAAKNGLAS